MSTNMSKFIDRIILHEFKSIKTLDLKLNNINILIGANGSGKSNLISFFRLLDRIINDDLNNYVMRHGGADNLA